jgi:hypothetical protein
VTAPDVSSGFNTGGKRYHGVRYEDGTIAGRRCVVTVLPADGQAYELVKEGGRAFDVGEVDWGFFFRDSPKVDIPIANQMSIYEKRATYHNAARKRSDADWARLERHQKKCRCLALHILCDLLPTNHDAARKVHKEFSGKIIERLPEKEWWLTEKQIDDAVGASMVLAALSTIKG